MGLQNPNIGESEPFKDHIAEGESFVLLGARTVKASSEYGDGDMVLLKVGGHDKELSLWGKYLVRQAKSAVSSDFGQRYTITEQVVPGFSNRPVKCLIPAPAKTATEATAGDTRDDVPF